MKCPSCGGEITEILACHTYTISYNTEQGKWLKETGGVVYNCAICMDELGIHDIEDILRQVDEL